MKHASILAPIAAFAAFVASDSMAQMGGHGSHMSAPMNQTAQSAKSTMVDGEVRKVDRINATVTLKHGPLTTLGMGPMTMTFTATDPKLLANVKEGDMVRFEPAQAKDGTLLVSRLEVMK